MRSSAVRIQPPPDVTPVPIGMAIMKTRQLLSEIHSFIEAERETVGTGEGIREDGSQRPAAEAAPEKAQEQHGGRD